MFLCLVGTRGEISMVESETSYAVVAISLVLSRCNVDLHCLIDIYFKLIMESRLFTHVNDW